MSLCLLGVHPAWTQASPAVGRRTRAGPISGACDAPKVQRARNNVTGSLRMVQPRSAAPLVSPRRVVAVARRPALDRLDGQRCSRNFGRLQQPAVDSRMRRARRAVRQVVLRRAHERRGAHRPCVNHGADPESTLRNGLKPLEIHRDFLAPLASSPHPTCRRMFGLGRSGRRNAKTLTATSTTTSTRCWTK